MKNNIDYGTMHAISEAMLMARRIYAQHLRRYTLYGTPLLSEVRPAPDAPTPLEDYVAECVVRYDFLHSEDQDYPGIDTVTDCFSTAFSQVYLLPLGEH